MRKLHKSVKQPKAFLVEMQRYCGPFVKTGKTEMDAVFASCEQLGVFYLSTTFNVREIRCASYIHLATLK